MLGREVSTPLDLIYKLPSQVKAIPQNQWAWEHMDEAHQIVQRHASSQIIRQKKNHNKNVSWAKFEPGNMVYVYFPFRTPGLSPKFTNQWRGPYKVIKINSSFTYTVNCDRKGAGRVIHVYRMRPCPQQVLREGEPCRRTKLRENRRVRSRHSGRSYHWLFALIGSRWSRGCI